MEGSVTVDFVALDARSHAFLLTQVAGELPACWWDIADAINGLYENRVREANLRDPQSTCYVAPAIVIRLL